MKQLLIGLIIFFLVIPNAAHAQVEVGTDAATLTPVPESDSVEYFLPYPGLLPDSPLYFLKSTRDTIIGLLISSPMKKAEFHLLQSDKSLQSGYALLQKKKKESFPKAIDSLKKSQTYFENGLSDLRQAKAQKIVTGDLANKMRLSSQKHQEILRDLQQQFPKEKDQFAQFEKRMQDLEKSATALTK